MTFPQTPLDLRTEIDVGGWADITDRTYTRDAAEITRGRADEATQPDPAKAKLQINNRTRDGIAGWYSPRNPLSPYYGLLGRNTPLRKSLPGDESYLTLPGGTGDYLSAPDTAALSITGDIDVRLELSLDDWRADAELCGKYVQAGNQRSWAISIEGEPTFTGDRRGLCWYSSTDGTLANRIRVHSRVAMPYPTSGRQAVRVTVDVNDGAGNKVVSFYIADSIAGSWTLLSTRTVAGTTSIFDSTAPVTVGYAGGAPFAAVINTRGRAHAFELRSGIGGTLVADLDATAALFGQPYLAGVPVQQASGVSASVVLTATAAVPAGAQVALVMGTSGGATVSSVADSRGNTYNAVTSETAANPRTYLYRATLTTAVQPGDTYTFVMSTAANAFNLIGVASTGVLAVDVSNHATGTSTSPSVTSAALAGAYELAIGCISNGNGGGSPVWPSPWSVLATAHNGTTQWTSLAYRTTSSAAAVTASATIVSATWTALVATFTAKPANVGGGPFVDPFGNVWTAQGLTVVDDRDYRFYGEVSSWPPRWDVSENDVWVPIEASGITRRLGQGASPLHSTLYRGLTTLAQTLPVVYWPCEDESGTSIASALPGGKPMIVVGSPSFAGFDGFAASDPLPTLGNSTWTGRIPTYAVTGQTQVRHLLALPAAGVTNNAVIARVLTSGTAARWDAVYTTAGAGSLDLRAYDSDGTILAGFPSGTANNLNGRPLRISFELTQNGANVDVSLTIQFLDVVGAVGLINTATARTVGRVTSIIIDPTVNVDDAAVGHISLHTAIADVVNLDDELHGYDGERAADRFARLCIEEGIPYRIIGDPEKTATMGPQRSETFLDLLTECADADSGIRYEPRDMLGVAFRARHTLYNQAPALALDYAAAGHVAPPLEPVDDDQAIRNDITVTRKGGSSARVVQETGPLSIQPPPDGVGKYDTTVTVNVQNDDDLPDQAGWRRHLGTTDEARYPQIHVDLAALAANGETALAAAARALDLGDRATIDNPPAWMPPDQISQLAQGFVETFGEYDHDIEANCTPESAWRVGVFDDPATTTSSRYSSDGSTLNEDLTTTETDVDVATPSGPLWSHDDGDFDVVIGGERMTVTAVSGTSSPQTFTVVRSVNGIVKTHSAGAAMQLFQPAVYAL